MIARYLALRAWRSLTWSALTTLLLTFTLLPPLTHSSRASLERLSRALQALEDMVTDQRPCERCCGWGGRTLGGRRAVTLEVLRSDVRTLLREGVSGRDLLRTVVWELYATNSYAGGQPSYLELYEEIRDNFLLRDNVDSLKSRLQGPLPSSEGRQRLYPSPPPGARSSDFPGGNSPPEGRLRSPQFTRSGCDDPAVDGQGTEVHGPSTGSDGNNRMLTLTSAAATERDELLPARLASPSYRGPPRGGVPPPSRPSPSYSPPSTGNAAASVRLAQEAPPPRPARPLTRMNTSPNWMGKGPTVPRPTSKTDNSNPGHVRIVAHPKALSLASPNRTLTPDDRSTIGATATEATTTTTTTGSDVTASGKHTHHTLVQQDRLKTDAPPWIPNFPPKPAGLYVLVDITDPTASGEGQRSIQQKVTLEPSTGVFDVLRQASLLYETQDGGGFRRKPLVFQLGKYQDKCYILRAVLGKAITSQTYWTITVKDSSRNVLFSDICIPNQRHLVMKPGYTIYLNYRPLPTARTSH